jgi:hypothetical protein
VATDVWRDQRDFGRCEVSHQQSLENWLSVATQNLEPRAAQKVWNEIAEHVENSVHQHQLEGMSEFEARALAVKELGDAHVSAKEFERTYLTASEFERLTKNKKQAKGLIWIGLAFLGVSAWMLYSQVSASSVSLPLLLFYLSQALYYGVRGLAARRWSLGLFTISSLWLSIVSMLGTFFPSVALSREGSWLWLLLIGGLTVWGFVTTWQEARAWRELQKI